MRTQMMVSAMINLALRFMLVVLNAKLIAPTTPVMSVMARKTICFFCACCWRGRAGCYLPAFSLHELISTLKEDTQP